ncbi:MAG: hypothetical protein LRZ84_21900 [Desertifilum sp.]|nr:hypothetical protein [Desertifilum sp.]
MAKNSISTDVSNQALKYKPGGIPASFEVSVVNESEQFASFQVELIAAGSDPELDFQWYELYPAVSAKKPPGDSTKFDVKITNTPVPGFVGTMNLTVRVYSMELRDEDRQVLRLIVQESADSNPLKLELPQKVFQVYPLEKVEIPVRVKNTGRQSADVLLNVLNLEYAWLIEGAEQRLHLEPGGQKEVRFLCSPSRNAVAENYGFTIEAVYRNGIPIRIGGTLEVLPEGTVKFSANPSEQRIPPQRGTDKSKRSDAAGYELGFENASNVRQQVNVQVETGAKSFNFEVTPASVSLNPGEFSSLFLVANQPRKRWGFPQTLQFAVTPILSDERLGSTDPEMQVLKLRVLPIVPFWLQLIGGLGLLLLLILLWLQPYGGHSAPVTSVRFNGLADRVVSASNDQTLRSWRVSRRLQSRGVLAPSGKAVRVVRFRPVDNNWVAAGLENGEIQLWDVLSRKCQQTLGFAYQRDDRVFGLEFTQDSRYLFSGHGSGLVLQWEVAPDVLQHSDNSTPQQQRQLDFAVSDLALVGTEDERLAIGGRYNQLVLWDWRRNALQSLPYRQGGQDDYITSLEAASDRPYRLVTADNQGQITLWNMQPCVNEAAECEVLDEWRVQHPVRSVAISPNGCYLVSGGDDPQVKLWPLTVEGKRDLRFAEGMAIPGGIASRIAKLRAKINSVDIRLVEDRIAIATGSDDDRVRVYRTRQQDTGCE